MSTSLPELRYHPLVIVLTAVVGGILFDRFWPLSFWGWWFVAAAALALWLALTLQHRIALAGFAVLLAVAASAGAWHHECWYLFPVDDLGRYAQEKAQPVCVEVVARSTPRAIPPPASDPLQIMPIGERWRFDVDAVALRNGPSWQPVSGRASILVQGARPDIAAGDRVRCFAKLFAPPIPHNPGQRDWSAYFRASRVRCRLMAESPECLTVIERGSPWSLTRLLGQLRAHGNRMFERYLDPRQAELASAVLLGLREELDQSRNEAFLTTGTIHILSISGLHVGILAGALFWLMRRTPLPRGFGIAAVAAVILFYTLMVDAEPPVVRSTVLVLIACMALYSGREALGMNSLAAAAIFVLAINPTDLFNVGAQLSFLCVAGLIWYAPQWSHLENLEDKNKKTLDQLIMHNLDWLSWLWIKLSRSVRGWTMAGIVLWFLTLALVMARFHIFSPVAMTLNAPLWPLITLSMLSGFIVLFFGAICPPLGYVCGWLCDVSFHFLEWCVNVAHRLPYSHCWLPGPADWWLWVFYGGLGLWLAFPHHRPTRRHRFMLLGSWILIGLIPFCWPHDRNRIDCTFLSMGHGCAVLLELPSGQTMLYDAGSMGTPDAGARTISEYLWDRGITRLDSVVLSHPDIDHYNALPDLMQKISVGKVFVSPIMFEKDTYAVRVLRNAIDEQNIPVCEVRAGDRLIDDLGCVVDVLHFHSQEGKERINAGSLVLCADYQGRRLLLPGDLEASGLSTLLSQKARHCEVLLAPHHGSKKSNSPELAAWCKPRWVVFSGDGRWSTPEIEAPYRAVGGQILHTYADGAIHVLIDAGGIRVSPFIQR
jgi:competence protein ComEC